MEQRTLIVDGNVIYCYADGSVEFKSKSGRCYGLHRTFGTTDVYGYKRVRIYGKVYQVHRLVAMAFHPNPNNLPQVDHINRNKVDNIPENLRWVTPRENLINKEASDRCVQKYGIRCCDDRKAYDREHNKHRLTICKPDGTRSMTCHLTEEEMKILKPLTQKERYFKYNEKVKGNN